MDQIEVEVILRVRVTVNRSALGEFSPENVATGIAEQALQIGSDDMDRQAEADATLPFRGPDDESRSGQIKSWTVD